MAFPVNVDYMLDCKQEKDDVQPQASPEGTSALVLRQVPSTVFPSSFLYDTVLLRTCSNVWCDLWRRRVWSSRSLRTGWKRRKRKRKKLRWPTCPNTALLQTWVETKLPWWWAQRLGVLIHRTSPELCLHLWLFVLDWYQFNQFPWCQINATSTTQKMCSCC